MLQHQQFEDSESNKTQLRSSKYQQLYIRNDEEGESLDKFESEDRGKNIGYVLFFLIALSQKKLNRPTDIIKRTKNLNYLVYIPKISLSYNCFLYVRVSRQKLLKNKQKLYQLSQKGLESYQASKTSTCFNIINFHYFIRKFLESHLLPNNCQSLETQPCLN